MKQRTNWIGGITLCCLAVISPAQAQVVPDRTLPTKVNKANSLNFTINGGKQAGGNLFHSFSEFSVPKNGSAFFDNTLGIQNIISRVTGESVSNIDGKLKANGTANLFLLNPNGVVFGPGASLDIGGSFVATTANAIQFGNQGFFSASAPNVSPLLTVNPSAFLFNQMAAQPINPIEHKGSLSVLQDQSLLLVGGNVNLKGGVLNAPGGRVELGGVREPGTVRLKRSGNNLSLSFPDQVARADVSLNDARVDVTAGGGGSIAINAQNIGISDGSSLNAGIASGLKASRKAGDITLNATKATITGGSRSSISNIVDSEAKGNAGDINITTGSLQVNRRALLTSSTSGKGNAGNVTINAETVSLKRGVVGSRVRGNAEGNGGTITIRAGSLSLTEESGLLASTNGTGNAGSVTINAETVSLERGRVISEVGKDAVGNGGNITITTGELLVREGGQLGASTEGQGDAGSVTINTQTVSLEGEGQNRSPRPSGIFARVGKDAVGDGGDINIRTGSLTATNGARISTNTIGQGNAGNVRINALNKISLEGVGQNRGGDPRPSGIFSSANAEEATGSGGNITLETTNLSVIDGAEISAKTALGNGGNITLQVQELLQLRRGSSISTAAGGGIGDAGNIYIQAKSLSLIDGSNLSTFSFGGDGKSGNITIETDTLTGLENSDITTSAFEGIGGDINIKGQIIGLEIREALTDGSDIVTFSQDAPEIIQDVVDPTQGLVALPEEVDVSRLIAQDYCSASGGTAGKGESKFVVTGRGGLPPNPNEPLSSDTVLADWVTIDPKIEETPRSDPAPSTSQTSSAPASTVEAQEWVRGPGGQVILTAQAPTVTPHSPGPTPTSCRGS